MNDNSELLIVTNDVEETTTPAVPVIPDIADAKAAAEKALTETPLDSWSSNHVHSAVDREPQRPYTITRPNGTVETYN
jgi:hypothetical protein